MRKGIVPLDWALIASMLARESSVEQVEFFKAFINECRAWGTNFQIHSQLCEIAKNLPSADRELWTIFCAEYGME